MLRQSCPYRADLEMSPLVVPLHVLAPAGDAEKEPQRQPGPQTYKCTAFRSLLHPRHGRQCRASGFVHGPQNEHDVIAGAVATKAVALTAEGLPAICIDARHAKAALDMAANKTDANDADGLAHLAEVGFYREVRVKGFDSMLIRTLITARRQLLKMRLQISNQIRGLMKTFGLVVPKGAGSVFERNVHDLLQGEAKLARMT
jgi:transposase